MQSDTTAASTAAVLKQPQSFRKAAIIIAIHGQKTLH